MNEGRFLFFKLDEMSNVPIGLILAVVIGTVAGMLIGCFLLVIVFFFKQKVPRKLRSKGPDTSTNQYFQSGEPCQECSFSSLFKESEHSFQHDLSTVQLEASKYSGNDDPIILNKERELDSSSTRQTYALVETYNESKSANFGTNVYFSNSHYSESPQTVLF